MKLTANAEEIIRNYAKNWHDNCDIDESHVNIDSDSAAIKDISVSMESVDDEEFQEDSENKRCTSRCRRTRARCTREHGHIGRHKFTQKGRLSPSAIAQILNHVTSGKIRSLAGLDDIDVEKGSENFDAMKEMTRTLMAVGRQYGNVECCKEEELIQKN